MAFSAIASHQAEAMEATMKWVMQLLDYLVARTDETVRFYASDMILNIHSDASYCLESNIRNILAGYNFFASKPKKGDSLKNELRQLCCYRYIEDSGPCSRRSRIWDIILKFERRWSTAPCFEWNRTQAWGSVLHLLALLNIVVPQKYSLRLICWHCNGRHVSLIICVLVLFAIYIWLVLLTIGTVLLSSLYAVAVPWYPTSPTIEPLSRLIMQASTECSLKYSHLFDIFCAPPLKNDLYARPHVWCYLRPINKMLLSTHRDICHCFDLSFIWVIKYVFNWVPQVLLLAPYVARLYFPVSIDYLCQQRRYLATSWIVGYSVDFC